MSQSHQNKSRARAARMGIFALLVAMVGSGCAPELNRSLLSAGSAATSAASTALSSDGLTVSRPGRQTSGGGANTQTTATYTVRFVNVGGSSKRTISTSGTYSVRGGIYVR